MIGQIPRQTAGGLANFPASVFQRAAEILRIPTVYSRDLNALGP
ncbi:MAG: hypothetical protein HW389_2320 [Bacteroidetes bacterium]|nr:hypothetical protein [Bacteroidota bacterium]